MAEKNPDYELANDNIVFWGHEHPDHFPTVTVNDLPVPDTVQQYVLAQQRRHCSTGKQRPVAARALLGKEQRRLHLSAK